MKPFAVPTGYELLAVVESGFGHCCHYLLRSIEDVTDFAVTVVSDEPVDNETGVAEHVTTICFETFTAAWLYIGEDIA